MSVESSASAGVAAGQLSGSHLEEDLLSVIEESGLYEIAHEGGIPLGPIDSDALTTSGIPMQARAGPLLYPPILVKPEALEVINACDFASCFSRMSRHPLQGLLHPSECPCLTALPVGRRCPLIWSARCLELEVCPQIHESFVHARS